MKFSPNQLKILAVLKSGPYPEHLLANQFPYVGPNVKLQGKCTNGSYNKAMISCVTLKEKGVIEEFKDPNETRIGVRCWALKGYKAA